VKIIWIPSALQDLKGISNWIAEGNLQAALDLVRTIRRSTQRLAQFPHSGRAGKVGNTFELVVPSTSYIVVYQISPEQINILAVLHAARMWPDTFL
jgi:toxin ParE1/3/4